MIARVVLYCLVGGLPLTIAGLGAGHVGWWWLSGIVLAAAFVPVARYGPRGAWRQFAAIAPAVFVVGVFCIWTEMLLFMPQLRPQAVNILVGNTITYLIVAGILAVLARILGLTRASDRIVRRRPALSVSAIIIACGFAYALYYLVFGAVTYQYFTRGFYPDATQQVARLGGWFWPIQIGRGMLMSAAVLPLVYSLRMPRAQAACVIGALVWVAGGLAPLLAPNDVMGTTQRIIHIIEIFTQNASLGVTVVLLARPRCESPSLEVPATLSHRGIVHR